MQILRLIGKKLRSIMSTGMEQYSNVFKENRATITSTVVLDYAFVEGEDTDTYQLVRFGEGEPWNILYHGFLLGSLTKVDGLWIAENASGLNGEQIFALGKFIDSQPFNQLPDRIKTHWEEFVKEVVLERNNSYLVICREEIDFAMFSLMFDAFIAELVEDGTPVRFKVYNATFSDDFQLAV